MTLTADDVREVEEVTTRIADAEQAVRDLAERCRRKGDRERAISLDVGAAWTLETARLKVEGLFS